MTVIIPQFVVIQKTETPFGQTGACSGRESNSYFGLSLIFTYQMKTLTQPFGLICLDTSILETIQITLNVIPR